MELSRMILCNEKNEILVQMEAIINADNMFQCSLTPVVFLFLILLLLHGFIDVYIDMSRVLIVVKFDLGIKMKQPAKLSQNKCWKQTQNVAMDSKTTEPFKRQIYCSSRIFKSQSVANDRT